jgi:hypothetical protein
MWLKIEETKKEQFLFFAFQKWFCNVNIVLFFLDVFASMVHGSMKTQICPLKKYIVFFFTRFFVTVLNYKGG